MRALAVNISQAPKYATLAADMAYGDERREPDTQTVKSYLEMFKDLYLLTDLEGWEPPLRAKSRVRTKPKRYFVDPFVACCGFRCRAEYSDARYTDARRSV